MFKKLQKILNEKFGAELIRVSDIDNFVTRDALVPFKFLIRGSGLDSEFVRLKDAKQFIEELV
jgi:hypothetical protein